MWSLLVDTALFRAYSLQHFLWSFAIGGLVAAIGLFSMGLLGAAVYFGWQWLLLQLHLDWLPPLEGDRAWPSVILVSMLQGGIYPLLHGCNLLVRLPLAANLALALAWTLLSTFITRVVK